MSKILVRDWSSEPGFINAFLSTTDRDDPLIQDMRDWSHYHNAGTFKLTQTSSGYWAIIQGATKTQHAMMKMRWR